MYNIHEPLRHPEAFSGLISVQSECVYQIAFERDLFAGAYVVRKGACRCWLFSIIRLKTCFLYFSTLISPQTYVPAAFINTQWSPFESLYLLFYSTLYARGTSCRVWHACSQGHWNQIWSC